MPYDFAYMQNLKYKTNDQTNRYRFTNTENKLVAARGGKSKKMREIGEDN